MPKQAPHGPFPLLRPLTSSRSYSQSQVLAPILIPILSAQVDAALDVTNVARVAHYIRDKTRPPPAEDGAAADVGARARFQSIVISLKVRHRTPP